jgi:hypothetical protein
MSRTGDPVANRDGPRGGRKGDSRGPPRTLIVAMRLEELADGLQVGLFDFGKDRRLHGDVESVFNGRKEAEGHRVPGRSERERAGRERVASGRNVGMPDGYKQVPDQGAKNRQAVAYEVGKLGM